MMLGLISWSLEEEGEERDGWGGEGKGRGEGEEEEEGGVGCGGGEEIRGMRMGSSHSNYIDKQSHTQTHSVYYTLSHKFTQQQIYSKICMPWNYALAKTKGRELEWRM